MSPDHIADQDVINGTYRIERLLGEGGMGAVYEVSHLRLGRRFALKLLAPHAAANQQVMARFEQEAAIIGQLGHPHIVHAVDFDYTPDGAPFIVMELLEGEDLAALLKRVPQLGLRQVASIVRQTASALHAAHQQEIVHRDLKPQNIFLCRRGLRHDYVKVLDFGISKVLGMHSSLTRSKIMIGTPGYMAPEQAEARLHAVDARTDVFAMGIIAYQMIGGRPPFYGNSPISVLYAIVNTRHGRLSALRPDVPEAVEEAISKALRKHPDERQQSVLDFSDQLTAAIEVAQQEDLQVDLDYTEDRRESWVADAPAAGRAPASEGAMPPPAPEGPGADERTLVSMHEPAFPLPSPAGPPSATNLQGELVQHFLCHCTERQERCAALATDALEQMDASGIVSTILGELHDFLGEAQFLGLEQTAAAAQALIEALDAAATRPPVKGQGIKLMSWARRLTTAGRLLAVDRQDPDARAEVERLRQEFASSADRDLRRVLICDDSLIVRSVLAQDLETRGYAVALASDAGEVEHELAKFSPEMIFLDINLPTINGDEICRRVREQRPSSQIPIIFLSSLSDRELSELALRAGADGYISKRRARDRLLACLALLLP